MSGAPRLEPTLLGGFDGRLPRGAALAFPTRTVGALLAFLSATGTPGSSASRCSAPGSTRRRSRRYRLQRGEIAAGTSCMAWLLATDPFQLPADAEHYASGLRLAGLR